MSIPTKPIVAVIDIKDIFEGISKKKYGETIADFDPTELVKMLAGTTDCHADSLVDSIASSFAGDEEDPSSADKYAEISGSTYQLYVEIKDRLSENEQIRPYADKCYGECAIRGTVVYVKYVPEEDSDSY
jgi:hypothetical protein